MTVELATDQASWDQFLSSQPYSPFLQSWTMGEVYRDCGQEPIRIEVRDGNDITAICQAIVVPARRGRHLSVPYGPIISSNGHWSLVIGHLTSALKEQAKKHSCSFIRLSPFWEKQSNPIPNAIPSPMHMLAEHIWYIDLSGATEESIQKNMRKNTRNLIRRAAREGVTIERSQDPLSDLPKFIELHEETRKRHSFTPYTNTFFTAQVKHFSARNECTMYKALYEGEVIACSVHMHAYGETSYHHGASTHKHAKIPASYLLQWTAIQDALKRGDKIYNFWGIAPEGVKNHPFAGVTTFKRGFGGQLLELQHCQDIPVSKKYWIARGIETLRKWKRGF